MRSMARWCVSHRRAVVVAWLVALIALAAISKGVGSGYKNSFTLNGTQSFEALHLLQRAAPKASGDHEQVVFAVSRGTLRSPSVEARAKAMLRNVAALPEVASVLSPYSPAGAEQVSRSGQVAFANVTMTKLADKYTVAQAKRFVDTAKASTGNGLQVAVGGQVAEQSVPNSVSSAGFGVIAALIVLFLVFGSLLAAVLPLITAGVALGVGTAVIGLLSHVLTMASFSSDLSLLIGLGVGVDYALFVVTRLRQGLERGLPTSDAIVDALDTSGRAVLFAGVTVCIALLGMFALGVSFLYGVGLAAAVVVAFTVLSALTLLPALLGFMGPHVLSRHARHRLAQQRVLTADGGRLWTRWAAVLRARPAVAATVGVVLMAVIAIPFFSMRLGSSDAGSDPPGSTTRQAYDLLAKGFGPGYNGPLQLVAAIHNPRQKAAFIKVSGAVANTPGVVGTSPPLLLPGKHGAPAVISINAYPAGSPQAASTSRLLTTLRGTVVPRAQAGSGVHVLIGGQTATFTDFANVLSSKLALFIGVIVGLSFLLLIAVFRSLVVPAMAALMNMLSVGAAFGVITAVFQWGWASSLLGVNQS
ncbi:MAG: MMPL family transporter, partial [Solirubrobacteraceae bacterium]